MHASASAIDFPQDLTVTETIDNRELSIPALFDLRTSVGPARWVGDRSPRHAWIGDSLIWCGREGQQPITRVARQAGPGLLSISGATDDAANARWARDVLMVDSTVASWDEPVVADIASRFPGLGPYGDGSLFEGLITSIVGQSISVASAAVTQRRLAFLFEAGVERMDRMFAPLPTAEMLAGASVELIRSSGVTMRRAEALKKIGGLAADGQFPTDVAARQDPDFVVSELLSLPQVGKWTAASAVHWGVGAPDAWPPGDVALLRAVRFAFDDDGLTMSDIDRMSEKWRPFRGVAARLLWTNLFETRT